MLAFTFCLASITLASKSAGITLPLEKTKAAESDARSSSVGSKKAAGAVGKPFIRVQQDQVLGPEAQSCAGLLDGVVALQGHAKQSLRRGAR